jgi:hypothetical protein
MGHILLWRARSGDELFADLHSAGNRSVDTSARRGKFVSIIAGKEVSP